MSLNGPLEEIRQKECADRKEKLPLFLFYSNKTWEESAEEAWEIILRSLGEK